MLCTSIGFIALLVVPALDVRFGWSTVPLGGIDVQPNKSFHPTGMHVLDCWCGPGSITGGLVEHVAPGVVISIDITPAHFTLAQTRTTDARLSHVRFATADI
jgi:hypothetical protein